MISSLSYIFIFGLALASICSLIKIPSIVGMLAVGIILGPYVLDLLDLSILGISDSLIEIALIVILIKAGLSIGIRDLKKVGVSALLLSFIPALTEIIGAIIFASIFFNFTFVEGAILGCVLGAVSPAVVVSKMVKLIDENYGTNKSIPQLMLSGSSLDDVFVIVLFSTFLEMAVAGSANFVNLVSIPISIITGVTVGVGIGFFLAWFFETMYQKGHHLVRNSLKLIIMLGFAFLLVSIEEWLSHYGIPFSGLISVMTMSVVLRTREPVSVRRRLSDKFGKIWIFEEVLLFVLVGAKVDVGFVMNSGIVLKAVGLILLCLVFRSAGVFLSLIKTGLNFKEKLFCTIAYIPKATVQAAIGAIPLSSGLECGQIILAIAVISIIVTAPLGALGIDLTYKKLLVHDETNPISNMKELSYH